VPAAAWPGLATETCALASIDTRLRYLPCCSGVVMNTEWRSHCTDTDVDATHPAALFCPAGSDFESPVGHVWWHYLAVIIPDKIM